MGSKGDMPLDKWLQHLESTMFGHTPSGEIDWESGINVEVALRIAGGSLAVGMIDSVVSVKELIDTIVRDAEAILAKNGRIGRIIG